jgi:hypothetical protein
MTSVEKPLARKLLVIVVVLSIVVTGLASAATFAFVQRSLMERQVASLQIYVQERTAAEDRLFSDLVKVHGDATEALMRRIERVKGPAAAPLPEAPQGSVPSPSVRPAPPPR